MGFQNAFAEHYCVGLTYQKVQLCSMRKCLDGSTKANALKVCSKIRMTNTQILTKFFCNKINLFSNVI